MECQCCQRFGANVRDIDLGIDVSEQNKSTRNGFTNSMVVAGQVLLLQVGGWNG